MQLLTFENDDQMRLGVLTRAGVVDALARDSDPRFSSMQSLIEGGPEALDRLRQLVDEPGPVLAADSIRWLPPLPCPVQMRDFIVFEEHMRVAGWHGAKLRHSWGGPTPPTEAPAVPAIWYRQPLYYKCNRFAVGAPNDTVAWPAFSKVIDYELELACILWKRGKDIPVAEAADYIFGYTILNDLTARDAQFLEMQGPLGPAKGKDFDGANVMGPVIVTADELDTSNLGMRARVNGELWSDGSSASMHWSFAQIIEHVSRSETLHPGEVLGSGTVGGGCGLELGRFLKHGDHIELEIEGIGRLGTHINAPHVQEAATL